MGLTDVQRWGKLNKAFHHIQIDVENVKWWPINKKHIKISFSVFISLKVQLHQSYNTLARVERIHYSDHKIQVRVVVLHNCRLWFLKPT